MQSLSLRGWEVAIDNGETLHIACHGRRLACLKKKTVGKQRFRRWSISKPQPILHYCKTSNHFMFFCFSQSILIISDILTKIYKITIACFKPTISVGSTLAHARYYLDDPVHLLVSCAGLQKCDCNFVHQLLNTNDHEVETWRLDFWRFRISQIKSRCKV